jgi:hypothetical protein
MSRKSLILAAAVLLPFSAYAADSPKEGTDKFTVRFVNVSSLSPMKQGDATVYTYDNSGAQFVAAGSLFDHLGVRCVGIFRQEGDKGADHGYCVKGDKDGNQYWEAYEGVAGKGTSKVVGGVGKFAGLTGDIDYTVEQVGDANDRYLNIVSATFRWKLP